MSTVGISKVYGYNPYTLENHSTADLYYDATNQTLGYVFYHALLYAARVHFHAP